MLYDNILVDRVKNCIKEVEEMFPWIVVLAVLGLVMLFAEILIAGVWSVWHFVQSPFSVRLR